MFCKYCDVLVCEYICDCSVFTRKKIYCVHIYYLNYYGVFDNENKEVSGCIDTGNSGKLIKNVENNSNIKETKTIEKLIEDINFNYSRIIENATESNDFDLLKKFKKQTEIYAALSDIRISGDKVTDFKKGGNTRNKTITQRKDFCQQYLKNVSNMILNNGPTIYQYYNHQSILKFEKNKYKKI